MRSFRAILLVALCLFLTGGPMSVAENDGGRYDIIINRSPGMRINRDPREIVRPVQRRAPVAQPKRLAPSTVVVDDKPAQPKVEVTTFVAVIGDSLADLVANGLTEALAEMPEVAVLDKSKADSGLVRTDFYDWPKAVDELLASPEKVSFAVAMLGANDRQQIRDAAGPVEPFTDRWKELYGQRVEAIARAFAEKKIPLVWVGLPPMKNERMSADMTALNDLFRERVTKQGGIYADLWDGFVDAEGDFAASGPDVSGQIVRLRTADGVHFTKAGARKAAHFVELELKKLFDTRGPANIVAVQTPADQPAEGPPPELAPGVPAKPVAGPILPLTRVEVSPGGALIATGTRAVASRAAMAVLERVFVDGHPPEPVPGRADDFRWPRAN